MGTQNPKPFKLSVDTNPVANTGISRAMRGRVFWDWYATEAEALEDFRATVFTTGVLERAGHPSRELSKEAE